MNGTDSARAALKELKENSGWGIAFGIILVVLGIVAIVMPVVSVSWNASVPIAAMGTCPQITTIGTESAMLSRTGVTMLVAPGPEVTIATPTLPLARA